MQRAMRTRFYSIALAFVLAAASPAAFGASEGTAVGVDPDAVARINSQDRILEAGTDVSVGELIVTGPSGQVQIVFDDDTRLVVGPSSSLKIETYLLASSNVAQKLTINALGGSFRFITGNSPKPAYSINTPTASIAVRGTKLDLLVGSIGTGVMLYEGALQLCAKSSACVELTDRCEIGTAVRGGAELIMRANPEHPPLAMQFRYARFQTPLLNPFRINGASNCVAAQQGGAPSTIITESGGSETETPTPRPTPTPVPTPGN
ncbi:FecR family protein [Devosia sp. SL43]|uniref:FecR family protein n=1 Tax=Devosia sp. SL43 TaxID=2806348 RepID=UPI001F365EC7|nr:FecR domain-containing protein [Devosia sp. SL43]UJW86264.1 FecR domain-containing protein [Devosia sp. SL43]